MLRKTSSWVAMAAVILTPMGSASAQGLPPEDGGFEIETEESVKQPGFFENLSQYVGATAGATSGSSNAVDKSLQAMNIQVDVPMPRGFKAAFSVDVGNYENIYTLELDEGDQQNVQQCQTMFPNAQGPSEPDPNDFIGNPEGFSAAQEEYLFWTNDCDRLVDGDNNYFAPSKEITVEDSFSDLNEAFIQWEPTSFLTLQAGRQPIVMGQFEAFSPLMFLLPMKSTGTKTRTAKADLSYAQDGFNVSLFPLPNVEISYVAVAGMRLDPSTEKRLEEFALSDGDELRILGGEDPSEQIEDIGDHDLSVARIMYFGDRLTFGATAIEGVDSNMDMVRDARIVRDGLTEYALDDDKGARFPEMSATAIELSYRLGSKWTFVMEYTEQETEIEYSVLPSRFGDADFHDDFQDVIDIFDGKPVYDANITMGSVGFVFKGDRWLANLQLAQRTEEGATAEEERLSDALSWDAIYNFEDTAEDTLPILNVARLLGEEKQGYAGAGFGVFAQSFGFGLTAGWRYFEKLEVGAFMGMALDVTGADTIEQQGYESPEGESFVNFGINYLF